jgi:hypothetical protein
VQLKILKTEKTKLSHSAHINIMNNAYIIKLLKYLILFMLLDTETESFKI